MSDTHAAKAPIDLTASGGAVTPSPADGGGAPASSPPQAATTTNPPEPVAAAPAAVAEPVVTKEAAAAPAAEAAPAAAADPAKVEREPTLLEKFDADKAKPAETKPAEAEKPAAEAKPAEAKPDEAKPAAEPTKPDAKPDDAAAKPDDAAKPPEPPPLAAVEYKYELPETIKLDDAGRTEFHTALDKFRADPAAGAQELVNLHNTTMEKYATHLANEQMRVWNETTQDWQKKVMADERIGGAGHQTAMSQIATVRDLGVPVEDRAAFTEFLNVTGAGSNPAFLRFLHRMHDYLGESKGPAPDPKPVPNAGRRPGRASIYDHPTSPQPRS